MVATHPQTYVELVNYLKDHPRVYCWHPREEEAGERFFQHADEYGRFWFTGKHGAYKHCQARGYCRVTGLEVDLGFRSDGFNVRIAGLTLFFEFLGDAPKAA